jgi:hypothetical protein
VLLRESFGPVEHFAREIGIIRQAATRVGVHHGRRFERDEARELIAVEPQAQVLGWPE